MRCESAIAEFEHLVNGRVRIDTVLELRDIEQHELQGLYAIAGLARLDVKTRHFLGWPEQRQLEELRWYVSANRQYLILRHIEDADHAFDSVFYETFVKLPRMLHGDVDQIFANYEELLESDRGLRLRLGTRKTAGLGKLIKRVNYAALEDRGPEELWNEVRRAVEQPKSASDDALACAFITQRDVTDKDQKIGAQIKKEIVRRNVEREGGGHRFFDLTDVSLEELENRRARGRKTTNAFFKEFPHEWVHRDGRGDIQETDRRIKSFLWSLSDDEATEFFLVYFGLGQIWADRTKFVLMAADERIRPDYWRFR